MITRCKENWSHTMINLLEYAVKARGGKSHDNVFFRDSIQRSPEAVLSGIIWSVFELGSSIKLGLPHFFWSIYWDIKTYPFLKFICSIKRLSVPPLKDWQTYIDDQTTGVFTQQGQFARPGYFPKKYYFLDRVYFKKRLNIQYTCYSV